MTRPLFAALLIVGLMLGGCTLPTINLQSQVDLNTLEGVVSGYGILAEQLKVLKGLPLCKTGAAPSATNICVKRSIIVALQNGMTIAQKSVDSAVAFVATNPTVSPTSYISAASAALLAVQTIYNTNKPAGT
jgi:hypothetical protein